jgi:hypothetical protein
MMLAMLLCWFLGIAAMLAASTIFATWAEYGSAWDAVDADMRSSRPAPVRYVSFRMERAEETGALVHRPEFRTQLSAVRTPHERRAAA